MSKPNQIYKMASGLELPESSTHWDEAEHIAEQGLGSERFGWIRWYRDANNDIKVASHSTWIARIGVESIHRGCEFAVVNDLVREADQRILKEHLDVSFGKGISDSTPSETVCVSPQLPFGGMPSRMATGREVRDAEYCPSRVPTKGFHQIVCRQC